MSACSSESLGEHVACHLDGPKVLRREHLHLQITTIFPGLGGWAALEIQHVLYCYIPAHSELSKGRQYNDPPQWGEGSRFLEVSSLSWISEAEGVFGLARSQHACVCPSPPPALLYIADVYGKPTDEGILIRNRFTHQELANMIHTSRVSVANVFSELTKCGIIAKRDGHYIILKPDELYV